MSELTITPGRLTLRELRAVHESSTAVRVEWPAAVDESVASVKRVMAAGETVYGINTGFGLLAQTRIAPEQVTDLQRALVLSHAAGVGEPIDDALVRLTLVLKINTLARGYSGIRREVIERLVALVNAEVYPTIPVAGSVGASGDLAPLAHLAAVLLGEGTANHHGTRLPADEALAAAGTQPVELAAKEGLALLNGTQVSTAYALRALFDAEDLFAAATIGG
ncbi:MAG: aromatic amino acid lyase, partial [Actinomycetota bacterium]|nr:aromatic amino acid lyase [Actinomycetota bacterium]